MVHLVSYLFLYLFICAPTTAFTCLSTFCTLHLSSTFYLSQDTSLVQGFIFEGDLQFSNLFKMTICKGMCTLKCTEKRVILFTPLHLLHKFVPIQNLKEALNMSTGMYCNIHLLEIMRRLAFKSPLSYPSS
jgi:hypothetical protein